jgi:serine/threonine-protein phosphatase 6 regulatory ankyrin repeat subunit B
LYTYKSGWTALHLASYHRQKEVADTLIRYGADVNIEDEDGLTPLMVTSKCDMAVFLISKGAFINKTTDIGESAFTRALKNHQEKLLGLLLHAHAYVLDEKIQSLCTRELPVSLHALYVQERDEQRVAFKLLTMKKFSEILDAYTSAKDQDNKPLMQEILIWIEGQKNQMVHAALNNDVYMLSELLQKGIDPMHCFTMGLNIVLYCALTGRGQVTELLLTHVPKHVCSQTMQWILGVLGYTFTSVTSNVSSEAEGFQQSLLSIDEDDISDIKDE